MKPRTRAKIEELVEAGWKFDADAWKASCERHAADTTYDAELVGVGYGPAPRPPNYGTSPATHARTLSTARMCRLSARKCAKP